MQNLSSAAVVIGALRVKLLKFPPKRTCPGTFSVNKSVGHRHGLCVTVRIPCSTADLKAVRGVYWSDLCNI